MLSKIIVFWKYAAKNEGRKNNNNNPSSFFRHVNYFSWDTFFSFLPDSSKWVDDTTIQAFHWQLVNSPTVQAATVVNSVALGAAGGRRCLQDPPLGIVDAKSSKSEELSELPELWMESKGTYTLRWKF